jgi:transcriptional regulator with XRE-family HTH domain
LRIRLHVKEVAEQKNFTRSHLARACDVQYSTINNLWNNPYVDVSFLVLIKLSRALNVDLSALYTIEENNL